MAEVYSLAKPWAVMNSVDIDSAADSIGEIRHDSHGIECLNQGRPDIV